MTFRTESEARAPNDRQTGWSLSLPDLGVSYRIDKGLGLAVLTIERPIALAGFAAGLDALISDPAFRPGVHVLIDRRSVPDVPSFMETRGRVGAIADRPALRDRRLAVLIAGDANYGMVRVAEVFGETAGLQVRAFRDERAALRWLATGDDGA